MLQPARTKYRKMHKGRNNGLAFVANKVSFGEYGLKAVEHGQLTARQIEAARRTISRFVKRGGKYYFYSTVDHKTIPGKAIGVAVSDSPTGPFVDARGSALVTNDMTKQTAIPWDDIDPAVFIDTEGNRIALHNVPAKYLQP